MIQIVQQMDKYLQTTKNNLNNATISISMKQQPSKTEYGYGDTIDLSGGKITVTKKMETQKKKY